MIIDDTEIEMQLKCNECLMYTMCMDEVYMYLKHCTLFSKYVVSAINVHKVYALIIYDKCPDTLPYVYEVKTGKHVIKQYCMILDFMINVFRVNISQESRKKYTTRLEKYIEQHPKEDYRKFSLIKICKNRYSFLNTKWDHPYEKV